MDDAKLDSPLSAYIYSSTDNSFTFFKIYTVPLRDNKTGEVGQFHFDYQNNFVALEQSSDPVGFLKAAIRILLTHAVVETKVPLEKWIVEFSPMMEKFGIPSHLFLDTARDRAWMS